MPFWFLSDNENSTSDEITVGFYVYFFLWFIDIIIIIFTIIHPLTTIVVTVLFLSDVYNAYHKFNMNAHDLSNGTSLFIAKLCTQSTIPIGRLLAREYHQLFLYGSAEFSWLFIGASLKLSTIVKVKIKKRL